MSEETTFQLVVQTGPEPGSHYELSGDSITIGRHSSNDVVIVDGEVSRDHARLVKRGDGYAVEDLGSSNGTYVNGQRVTDTRPLADGDLIGLGDSITLSYQARVDFDLATTTGPGKPSPFRISSKGRGQTTTKSHRPLDDGSETVKNRLSLSGCITQTWAILGVIATCSGLVTFILLEGPQAARSFAYNTLNIPVPLPCEAATSGEDLILITDFEQAGVMADRRIYRALSDVVEVRNLSNVRVEHLQGWTATNAEEALSYGERCNATAVVWGFADSVGMEAHIQPVRHRDVIYESPDIRAVAGADMRAYSSYVVESAPNQINFLMLFLLGQVRYFNEDYPAGIAFMNEALAIDLGEAREGLDVYLVYYYLGDSNIAEGDLTTALEDLDRAIDLNPEDYQSYYLRGFVYISTRDYERALDDLTQAIELNPEPDIAYYLDRGWVNSQLHFYEASVADYDLALALDPEHVTALINQGYSYSKLGQSDAAMANFEAALALDPDSALALNNVAYEMALAGLELDDALAAANRAIELESDRSAYYDTRGYVYFRLGDYPHALEDFELALVMGETYSYYGRGLVREVQGDLQGALEDYELFLAEYPDDPDHAEHARERVEALDVPVEEPLH